MAARDYKFEYMLLNRLQCDCDYYLSAMAAEMLSIAFGPMTSRNKSIKCESFMTCCRLNLNGLQENKLMSMQQE